ncbi:MAG: hypothetical protein ACHQ7N_18005 [Candidatus Methylomirabilales bacterium]
MQDEARVVDAPAGGREKTDIAPPDSPPVRRAAGRESEPLLIELAWLVIEGAVLFRRLRGILARI